MGSEILLSKSLAGNPKGGYKTSVIRSRVKTILHSRYALTLKIIQTCIRNILKIKSREVLLYCQVLIPCSLQRRAAEFTPGKSYIEYTVSFPKVQAWENLLL